MIEWLDVMRKPQVINASDVTSDMLPTGAALQ